MKGSDLSLSPLFLCALLWGCGAQFISTSQNKPPEPSLTAQTPIDGEEQAVSFAPPSSFASANEAPPRLSIPQKQALSILRPRQEEAVLEGEPLRFAFKANEDASEHSLFPVAALASGGANPSQAVKLEERPADRRPGEPISFLLPAEERPLEANAPEPLPAVVLLAEAELDEGDPARLALPLQEGEGLETAAAAAESAVVRLAEAEPDEGDPAIVAQKTEEEPPSAREAEQALIAAPQDLAPVFFVVDSDILSDEAKQVLENQLMAFKIFQKTARILIEGRCDNSGTESYNIDLGRRRAERARGYLIERGIAKEKTEVVSYGESRPISLDDPSQNRRVSFVILPDK